MAGAHALGATGVPLVARRGWSLQVVVLAPVLALMLIAGGVLYRLVLGTVGEFADASIRENLASLGRSAFVVADSEVDRQHRDGRGGSSQFTKLHQLNARMRFESFVREHDIGPVIEADGAVDFHAGISAEEAQQIHASSPPFGESRMRTERGRDVYIRATEFAPWRWRVTLVKEAAGFEALVTEVRNVYAVSGILMLVVTVLLVGWLRQSLIRPIFTIAEHFARGQAPEYQGVRELEVLSARIGGMMASLSEKTLHLHTTLQSMSDGIAVFDADLRLVAWNQQFARLYQYPESMLHVGLEFAEMMGFNVERGDYGPGDRVV